jgi:protein-tyrosine phosphatase
MNDTNCHIPLTGAKNFRDFGGYATACGGTVRKGVLYRSDRLSELSSDDFSQIAPLGIRNVCDLRGDKERRNAPTRWGAEKAPNMLHMPLISDEGRSTLKGIIGHSGPRRDERAAREIMLGLYERLVTERQALDYYRQLFELIASVDNLPVLIHCSGGKDRTGVVCALILWSLGVDMEDIVADFMMSKVLYSDKVDLNTLAPQIFDYTTGGDWHAEALRPVFNVEPAYIETAFRRLKDAYGTAEAFLLDAVGLNADTITFLRRNLIAR